jgi:hypothetical protein
MDIVKLVEILIWPFVTSTIYLFNFKRINRLFEVLILRIENGAEFEFSSIKIGEVPSNLPSAQITEEILEKHLALVHSSWRYQKKDVDFGRKMYCFEVHIEANLDVLERIEYVKYTLHKSYPNPEQTKTNFNDKFVLKELAWGASYVKAFVKIKNQKEEILLKRYINLI